jgi:hypothetical protein
MPDALRHSAFIQHEGDQTMTIAKTWQSVMTEFPDELRTPMWHFAELLEERFVIPHQDFVELKQTVERLARAQERTEQRVEQLARAQEELTAAQKQTEQRLDRLAQAQERTEQRVEQLAQAQEELTVAQKQTEQRLDRLAQAQEKTEQTVQKLTDAVYHLDHRMEKRFKELGSRWGPHNEAAFRGTIRRIFRDIEGVTVKKGRYGGREVDVVIRNGEHILLEITARMHKHDIRKLYASADDYREKEGIEPTLMMATGYVSPTLMREIVELERPIEIFSYEDEDEEEDEYKDE